MANSGVTHHLMSCILSLFNAHEVFPLLNYKFLEAKMSISFTLFFPMAYCAKMILTELRQIE